MKTLTSSAPHIPDVSQYSDLADWGPQPDSLAGQSHSSGRLLFKGPDNSPESGVWVCTPGTWKISVPRDEFCHFVEGRVTYRRDDSDEVIEVSPGTCVLFPAGWTGQAEVTETIRNLYMLV